MPTSPVTDATFTKDVLEEKDNYVLVDFWAEWCGPCRMLSPVIEAMSDKFSNLKVLKLNTDENPTTSQEHKITGIPCCILFKDGAEVSRIVGYKSESAFEAELKQHIEG